MATKYIGSNLALHAATHLYLSVVQQNDSSASKQHIMASASIYTLYLFTIPRFSKCTLTCKKIFSKIFSLVASRLLKYVACKSMKLFLSMLLACSNKKFIEKLSRKYLKS